MKSKQHKHAENEFIIVIVAIVALVALAVVGIFGDQFVGQAIADVPLSNVGFQLDTVALEKNGLDDVKVPVIANVGLKKTGYYEFTLVYDANKIEVVTWVSKETDWKYHHDVEDTSTTGEYRVKKALFLDGTPLEGKLMELGHFTIKPKPGQEGEAHMYLKDVMVYNIEDPGKFLANKAYHTSNSPLEAYIGEKKSALAGDVDNDGCVNVNDIKEIIKVIDLTCSTKITHAADVTGDQCVNHLDIKQIIQNIDLMCEAKK